MTNQSPKTLKRHFGRLAKWRSSSIGWSSSPIKQLAGKYSTLPACCLTLKPTGSHRARLTCVVKLSFPADLCTAVCVDMGSHLHGWLIGFKWLTSSVAAGINESRMAECCPWCVAAGRPDVVLNSTDSTREPCVGNKTPSHDQAFPSSTSALSSSSLPEAGVSSKTFLRWIVIFQRLTPRGREWFTFLVVSRLVERADFKRFSKKT